MAHWYWEQDHDERLREHNDKLRGAGSVSVAGDVNDTVIITGASIRVRRTDPAAGKLIYLASPYSHPSAEVRHLRYAAALKALAVAAADKLMMFSPIVHSHPVAEAYGVPGDWEFWAEVDKQFLSRCDELWVLTIDGWRESRGVTEEFRFAHERGIRTHFMELVEVNGFTFFSAANAYLPEEWI